MKIRTAIFWAVAAKMQQGEFVVPETVRYTRDGAWKAYEKRFTFPKEAQKKLEASEVRLARIQIEEASTLC